MRKEGRERFEVGQEWQNNGERIYKDWELEKMGEESEACTTH